MRKLFTDMSYISEEKLRCLNSDTFEPNLNAFTLVITSVNHLYSKMNEWADGITNGQLKNRKMNFKYYYIACAKLFLIDTFLWGAMFSDKDEIFYQDVQQSQQWQEIMARH